MGLLTRLRTWGLQKGFGGAIVGNNGIRIEVSCIRAYRDYEMDAFFRSLLTSSKQKKMTGWPLAFLHYHPVKGLTILRLRLLDPKP